MSHPDQSRAAEPATQTGLIGRSELLNSLGTTIATDKMAFSPRSLAESSNLWKITSHVYEPLWRVFSTHMLTGGVWSLKRECQIVSGWLSPKKEELFLDVGSSTGVYGRYVLEHHQESYAVFVDYSLPMLQKAGKRMGNNRQRSVCIQCNAASLPLKEGSVSGAVMGGTLNELAEPEKVLREILRVVIPGGNIVLMHLITRKAPGLIARGLKKAGIWLPSISEADAMFHRCGYRILDTKTAGLMRIVHCKS
ncbi:class I SAM-dependent methyltransferase [Balneolaceae bacterium ANBcel3]|nr:class I SAM-dependent methyltransferase [Balneolaceae bacterium ANBcel3]